MKKNILISGAGLVGSLAAVLLAKRGHTVTVVERRPDMRATSGYGGRSINLALSERGWNALRKAGVDKIIEAIAIPMYGRRIHNLDGSSSYQPYGKEEQAIYSVSRKEINIALMNEAEKLPNVTFLFSHKTISFDLHTMLCEDVNGTQVTLKADMILGADGAFSAIREVMQKTDRFEYSQSYISQGYKELTIPAGTNGEFQIEKNVLHIWPRREFMMIALPNIDGSFTCTLFLDYEGDPSLKSLNTEEKITSFFQREFASAIPLMPTLVKDYMNNPTSSLVTVRCYPWVYNHTTALIGDAAHAIVPFFGQGMNAGFEDCVILMECLDEANEDIQSALDTYQQRRKPNADAIADMALTNFVEMRDKVADPKFLERKKIESLLHKRFPDKFVPQYSMVSFSSQIPYSVALQRGKLQDSYLDAIQQIPNVGQQLDTAEFWQEVYQILDTLQPFEYSI